jgi:hypothetical protein
MPGIAVPIGNGDGEYSRPIWPGQRPVAHRILVWAAVPDMRNTHLAGHMNLPWQCLDRGGAVAVTVGRRHG